ncbi:MAG: AraC family transcriptional regulator [Christensenellales bacterium]|jgi:AraC-like DNA-binding protein/mannose-6-phosphate isomerase-like protein (cupin superfamily)
MKKLGSIQVNEHSMETRQHGNFAFPLQAYLDDYDSYDVGRVIWHWHTELEIGIVRKGKVRVTVPNSQFDLSQGDGFFINSNVLHMFEPLKRDSVSFSLVFSLGLIGGHIGAIVQQKYVDPILQCKQFPALIIKGNQPWHELLLHDLNCLNELCETSKDGYELAVTSTLLTFWHTMYEHTQPLLENPSDTVLEKDNDRIKCMIEYIHKHYAENISLGDIAQSAYLSVSECCRTFKRSLQTTPFDYLTKHRLSCATKSLQSGATIQDAYIQAGYNSQSYFGKQFKRLYGCTPREYQMKINL